MSDEQSVHEQGREHEAQKCAKDRALLSEQQAKADLQWLMGSEPGRRVVWRLLDEAGIFRSGFSPDALTMAFSAGMRERGLRLLHDTLHHCPGDYALMFAEQQRREEAWKTK